MSEKMNRSKMQPYVPSGEDGGEYRAYSYTDSKNAQMSWEEEYIRDKHEQEKIEKVNYNSSKPTFDEIRQNNDMKIADWFQLDVGRNYMLVGDDSRYIHKDRIIKETAKAILVSFETESADGESGYYNKDIWIPKSVIQSYYLYKTRERNFENQFLKGAERNRQLKELLINQGILKKDSKLVRSNAWMIGKMKEANALDKVKKLFTNEQIESALKNYERNNLRKSADKIAKKYGMSKNPAWLSDDKIVQRIKDDYMVLSQDEKNIVKPFLDLIDKENREARERKKAKMQKEKNNE